MRRHVGHQSDMSSVATHARRIGVLGVITLTAVTCGRNDASRAAAARRDSTPVTSESASAPAPQPAAPLSLDTGSAHVIELWPMTIAPGHQLAETRRIVEHMQADLSFVAGFERATLLASGDGASLLLVAEWADTAAADSGKTLVTEWLHAETDTALLRKRTGTTSPRVRVHHRAGTPPLFTDAAMLQITRYTVKRGHSFGALATLADSSLSKRVVQDTSALGGATLAAADSGVLYMVLQARTATVLDPVLQADGPLPFWAPFAIRKEDLVSVVAVAHRRQ
jgi:hypothetical protein